MTREPIDLKPRFVFEVRSIKSYDKACEFPRCPGEATLTVAIARGQKVKTCVRHGGWYLAMGIQMATEIVPGILDNE